ncbi:hypothetical protein B5S33_g1784 [[Candida] boidinii]|nr:hypothetical protein B5S30_g3049 [[Candida] boidinii]OWB83155.1 hypothetical protein B5S33_g1784 [[Candida] boidinii]GMG02038.1 unnamed protein product [[Candida] boidinii]
MMLISTTSKYSRKKCLSILNHYYNYYQFKRNFTSTSLIKKKLLQKYNEKTELFSQDSTERFKIDDLPSINSIILEINEKKNELNNNNNKDLKPKSRRRSKKILEKQQDVIIPEISDEITEETIEDRGSKTNDNSLTDFYQGMKDIIDKYDSETNDFIVLIQVGSFYELYFSQAEKYSNLLGLTLTKKKLKNQQVPFSGFPDYKIDKYLNICFNLNLRVVLCEQKLDPVKNIITRPVNRLITPGTIIDEDLRDYNKDNFILSISFPDDPFKDQNNHLKKIGLCWCDIGLSKFYILETNLNDLMSNILRINPSEILINNSIDLDLLISGKIYPELQDLKNYYITRVKLASIKKPITDYYSKFIDFDENRTNIIHTAFQDFTQKELSASHLLFNYIDECLPFYKLKFQLPKRSLPDNLMQIDQRAAQDLELMQTMKGGFKIGALANIIDKTVTSPGSRLLKNWLLSPSTDKLEILKRQKLITIFLNNKLLSDDLSLILNKTADTNKIIRRCDNGKIDLVEYYDLSNTIFLIEIMQNMIKDFVKLSNSNIDKKLIKEFLFPLFNDFNSSKNLLKLAKKINKIIDPKFENSSTTISNSLSSSSSSLQPQYFNTEVINKSWSILPTSSKKLLKLRNSYDKLIQDYETILNNEKLKFEQKGYTGPIRLIRDLKTFEFLIELKSSSKIIPNLIKDFELNVKDKTKSSMRYYNNDWKLLGKELIFLKDEIITEETIIIKELNELILSLSKEINFISPIIESLDISISFANLAKEKNLVCPIVDNSDKFEIIDGRHLVVEEGLKSANSIISNQIIGGSGYENFTSNSCSLNNSDSQSWVITGPNMGGKSTFLRQNAIIAILAQIGSYVPAKSVHLGIINRIFTRVGSSDNIFKNQSTFMVEMNETAIILRDATSKSLAIIDELGRGTSNKEGIAVAFGSLSYLIKSNKCKVLFATHYGPELVNLIRKDEELSEKIHFYKTTVQNDNDKILDMIEDSKFKRIKFNHKLQKGVSSHSHAFEIAGIAGFPREALKVVKESFDDL